MMRVFAALARTLRLREVSAVATCLHCQKNPVENERCDDEKFFLHRGKPRP